MEKGKKIGIIGAGQIGSTTTMTLDEKVKQIDMEEETYTITNSYLNMDKVPYPFGIYHKPPQYRRDSPKVHNNDPCTCGSEKKFKKCCKNKLV